MLGVDDAIIGALIGVGGLGLANISRRSRQADDALVRLTVAVDSISENIKEVSHKADKSHEDIARLEVAVEGIGKKVNEVHQDSKDLGSRITAHDNRISKVETQCHMGQSST